MLVGSPVNISLTPELEKAVKAKVASGIIVQPAVAQDESAG